MSIRIDRIVTSGIFSLDGQDFDVDNNVYVIGDETNVVVVDPAHQVGPILDAVGVRSVDAIVCTHAHNDHITAAVELSEASGAQVWLHPDDTMLWEMTHGGRHPGGELADGQRIPVASSEIQVLHTPGHSPGSCCFHVADLGVVFSGDTLFPGGPGATGRSFSDRPTLLDSIEAKLFTLDGPTRVLPGHGDETTIGAESPSLAHWRTET